MQILEKYRKKFPLIATILFGVALVALAPQLLLLLIGLIEMLFDGRIRFMTIISQLTLFVNWGLNGIVPAAFLAYALLSLKKGGNRHRLAICGGVALAQLLLTPVISFVRYLAFGGNFEWSVGYLFDLLPTNVLPYLLFAAIIVFSLKWMDSPVVPAVVAALITCVFLNALWGGVVSLLQTVVNFFFQRLDFWETCKILISSLSSCVYGIAFHGGLLLLVPLALCEKAPADGAPAEETPAEESPDSNDE